jgi:hypothetical protein
MKDEERIQRKEEEVESEIDPRFFEKLKIEKSPS